MTDKKKTKDDFIQKLSIMTPIEINQYIQEKGKEPKLTPAFCRVLCDSEGNQLSLN